MTMKSRPSSKRSGTPKPDDDGPNGQARNGDMRSDTAVEGKGVQASMPHRSKVNGEHANLSHSRGTLDRKLSSPMAPAFIVSAPGKVIVYGEHAVVHGKVCQLCLVCLSEHQDEY